MNQLNQSQASRDLGDSLKTITEQMESIVSALDIAQHIKAPIVERGFPHLVKNFNDAIQKHYESINKYVSELFSATSLTATHSYVPALLRSTRGDVAAQLSKTTQIEIAGYLASFEEQIDADVRKRYADYFDRFSTITLPPPPKKITPTATIIDATKQTLFGPTPQVDFKTGNEAVANYTISQNKIGIGREFANLPPKAKNFVLQHELGHSIFTRFQSLFPQRFEEILRSGIIGTWEGEEFQGVFGHEKTNPHETLADLYAYYMTNPQRMRKSHPQQYEFIDQFLNQEIFQNDVMNFAYKRIPNLEKVKSLVPGTEIKFGGTHKPIKESVIWLRYFKAGGQREEGCLLLNSEGELTGNLTRFTSFIGIPKENQEVKEYYPAGEPVYLLKYDIGDSLRGREQATLYQISKEEVGEDNRIINPPAPTTTVENITPQWSDKPYTSIPVLKPPTPQPIITPNKEITIPQPPQIIIPQEPPKAVITPTAEEVKKYSTVPKEPPPRAEQTTSKEPPKAEQTTIPNGPPKAKQTTEVTNRSLEMMNKWLEREYHVAAQLLKESRDGKKDSQKQAFDLKHLLSIAAEARLEAVKEALEKLEDIYVATGKDRPLTETFIRENIAETARTRTTSQIHTLLLNQGLSTRQASLLTDKYMKLIESSLPPSPPPPTTGGGGEWSWGDAARSIGKYALNRTVGGLFSAMDIIVDKAGLSLANILSRGMTINENLYYPLEMTMAGRMGRLMRTGGAAGFPEEFYTAMEEMWGHAIPTELAGTLMSNYTALLGSTTMENLTNQIVPLTNIARAIGVGPEQLLQPVAGMLRMMPERGTPQVYTQLSESIAKAIANADLTKAIGTDELLKVFTTLSKNYFGGAAEITPQSVQNALSAVSFLTTFGAPGLQGAVGLENLAKLNQSLMGRGATLTPLLYLGANYQAPEWGTNTMEKMVNIASQFSREGIFMQNRGTNEIFLFSLLRQIREMVGGDKSMATAILAREGNISTDVALALFNMQDTLEEQLDSGKITSENLIALVNAAIQGDQKAIDVMTQGTEVEQMQYYQLLEANSIYDQLTKNAGQLPLQIAMQGRKQVAPLLDKVYSALAEGAQGNVRGAFNQLVKAFSELPNIDKEGAAIMAYSALRNAGMTPQSLTEAIKQSLPSAIGTAAGAALGPTILANISTLLPWIIPIATAVVTAVLGVDWYKKSRESSKEREEKIDYFEEKVVPSLQEEGKSDETIKNFDYIWKALTDLQTNQFSRYDPRQQVYYNILKNIPTETLEQFYPLAVREGHGEDYIKLLKMYSMLDSVAAALESIEAQSKPAIPSGSTLTFNVEPSKENTITTQAVPKEPTTTTPAPNEVTPTNKTSPATPLSEFIIEKKDKDTALYSAPINNTTYYYFTINATPLPGETPEEMAKRIASQIMQQIEESQIITTRNRSAGK
ncbi:MAG TPA: hypothetical protein PLS98_05675 [Dictyoglomaceae bacterium]|nr:hypothetical protein [Dictyoglomaceae bacterium]